MCTLILTGIAGFALSVFTAGKIVSTQARARLAPSPSVSIHSPRPNAVLCSNEGVTINGTAANLQYRQLWIFVLRAWHFYDPYVGNNSNLGSFEINAVASNPSCVLAISHTSQQRGGGIAFKWNSLPPGCQIVDSVMVTRVRS